MLPDSESFIQEMLPEHMLIAAVASAKELRAQAAAADKLKKQHAASC